MSTRACPRLWEVEAARDGRLEGALLEDFSRHAAGCEQCSSERAALEGLARRLRDDSPPIDEVALRRVRQATLRRAAETIQAALDALPRMRARMFAALAAGALLASALIVTEWYVRAPHEPVLVMRSSKDAKWRRHRDQNVERIELDDGALSVSVRRAENDPRVVVHVPEGEIEDLGTVFKVTVRAGATVEVAVSEGAVIFHRRGQADLRLSAGIVWSPAETAPAPPARVATPRPEPVPPPLAPAAKPKSVHAPARARTQPFAPEANAASPAATPSEPAKEASSAAPPFDATGEDSAYLRVLALLSEGRNEEAHLAAAEYLRKFPHGFRRVEIDRIAHPTTAR